MKKQYLLDAGIESRHIERVIREVDPEKIKEVENNEYKTVVQLYTTITPEEWSNYELLFGKTGLYEQKLLTSLRKKLKKAYLNLLPKKAKNEQPTNQINSN